MPLLLMLFFLADFLSFAYIFVAYYLYREWDRYHNSVPDHDVMARGCLGMFGYDVTSDLPGITIPTLIIAANKDRLTRPDASLYMREHMPNAQLVTVAPGNHQALLERHVEVNEAAAGFIEGLK